MLNRDVITGAAGLGFSLVYFRAADALPVSLLADEVGADGMPKALAIGLAIASVLVAARAIIRPAAAASPGSPAPGALRRHLSCLGLAGIAALYVAAAPLLGYPLAIALLIAVTTVYFGSRPSWGLAGIAGLGALFFWAMFAKMLGIAMPMGIWPRLIG
jgi:putative tricarboxylic transport membrane protein